MQVFHLRILMNITNTLNVRLMIHTYPAMGIIAYSDEGGNAVGNCSQMKQLKLQLIEGQVKSK